MATTPSLTRTVIIVFIKPIIAMIAAVVTAITVVTAVVRAPAPVATIVARALLASGSVRRRLETICGLHTKHLLPLVVCGKMGKQLAELEFALHNTKSSDQRVVIRAPAGQDERDEFIIWNRAGSSGKFIRNA
jgi:hypothetical protein